MSITSMEELTALPEGTEIRIRSRQHGVWRAVKSADGDWLRDNSPVAAHFFVGYVAEGRVDRLDNTPIRPGDWLSNRRYVYFIVDENPEGLLSTLTWYQGEFRGTQTYTQDQISPNRNHNMTRIDQPPAGVANQAGIMAVVNAFMEVSENLRQRLAEVPPPLPQKDEAPKQERIMVTVHVNGRSLVPEPNARAAAGLPRSATLVEVHADWEYTYRYPVDGAPEACPCQASLDLTKVEAGLPPNTAQWNARASCVYGEYNPLTTTAEPF